MPLCQPSVVGPLSELSTQIRVQGQFPGASITVFTLTPSLQKVAHGTATSSDQRFSLLSGVHLSFKHLLVAVQEFNGDKSELPTGDLGIGVQPKPQRAGDIGAVGFVTHLFECGRFTWIGGVIPGAMAEVTTNHLLGSATAFEGYARFALSEALPHQNTTVHAHQVVPGFPNGPDISRAPDPIPPAPNRQLPPPIMNQPMRGCDRSIDVSGVIDGALVTISHDGGPTNAAGFDLNRLRFILPNPLKEGEQLRVQQEVAVNCERLPTLSPSVTVGPLRPVDPPVVKGPLCAGGTRVRVEQLRPGAIVHISANGTVFDGQAPPDRTWFEFTLPPLSGTDVSATQEACGVFSAPSAAVPVDPHEANIRAPTVVPPLFACARTVSLRNVHPGSVVQVFARRAGIEAPISDLVGAYATEATIDVSPYLHTDDDVFAAQWACSNTRVNSASEKVKAHPRVGPVSVLDPIFSGDTAAEVRDALPGALVELIVLRHGITLFAGSAVASSLSIVTNVPSAFAFATEDVVFATQTLCDTRSEPGGRVVVVDAPRFGPRPFYVIGHNPNTIAEVNAALDAGANAIEPDVNVFEADHSQLSISHGEGEPGDPSLQQFLTDLHAVALQRPELALVRFDCKPKVATAAHGVTLLNAIRTLLTFDTSLNILISVGSLSETAIFDSIKTGLLPREGLMVDEENDPVAVSNFFAGAGVVNQAFGNGISVLNAILGPNVRPSMERACELRAAINRPKYIDVWTVQDDDLLRRFIHIGVDGIITDTIGKLRSIMNEANIQPIIRLATRQDDPLRPGNLAYGLEVHTGDVWMGGTDAVLTFTVTGQNGASSITVDTKPPYRMERDDWNFLTLPSPDLGALQSITVQRDNSGNGPDWFLDRIRVRSFRFGVSKEAIFNRWIDTTSPFTRALP